MFGKCDVNCNGKIWLKLLYISTYADLSCMLFSIPKFFFFFFYFVKFTENLAALVARDPGNTLAACWNAVHHVGKSNVHYYL